MQFWISLKGTTLLPHERALIQHPLVGGVVLFRNNCISADQITRLCASIKHYAPYCIIATDQEGGRVQRIDCTPVQSIQPMHHLNNIWNTYGARQAAQAAYCIGLVIGHDLAQLGIHTGLSPVLDRYWNNQSIIGHRSLSSSITRITYLAKHLIDGLCRSGISSVGKHYPGHGYANLDTHTHITTDFSSTDQIHYGQGAPFYNLGHALDGIMLSHIIYPSASKYPASLSSYWCSRIKQINYKGLTMTDDAQMAALSEQFTLTDIVQSATQAGVDIILARTTPALEQYLKKAPSSDTATKALHHQQFTKKRYQANKEEVRDAHLMLEQLNLLH